MRFSVLATLGLAAAAAASPAPRMEHRRAPAPEPLLGNLENSANVLGAAMTNLAGAALRLAQVPLSQAKATADNVRAAFGGDPKLPQGSFNLPSIDSSNGGYVGGLVGGVLTSFGDGPTVKLQQGSYTGLRSSPLFQQEWFFGVPFAQAPLGNLRFRAPQKLAAGSASHNATAVPPACPQPNNYILHFNDGDPVNYRSEDCLNLNIYSPLGASNRQLGKLPVLFWLFGGGEIGGSANSYNSTALVLQSILQGQPIIVVTPQYRGNSFGFLAGKRVSAGEGGAVVNAGLHDVTAALEWTRDNIAAFGGDPDKITLGGHSSGAMNVGAQMLKDGREGGKPIYRSAIMLSGTGSSLPAPPSDSDFAEENYQRIAGAAGCGSSPTIDCLRGVDAIKLGELAFYPSNTPDPSLYWVQGPKYYAGNQPFQVTQDGVYQPRGGASAAIRAGKWPDVPLFIGNARDEGTIFVSRVMDAAGIHNNVKTIGFTDPNQAGVDALVDRILDAYKDVPREGAPYWPGYSSPNSRLGAGNQYERLASILGDFAFQSKRRALLDLYTGRNGLRGLSSPVWSYQFNETYAAPDVNNQVGATHGADPPFWFGAYNFVPARLAAMSAGTQASKSLAAFVSTSNPNALGNLFWPRYTAASPRQMNFQGLSNIIGDDFRPQMSIFAEPDAARMARV
ncbi:alpha/beta-hydrolase [Tilletiopsis washingtonensis]|jgi:carboxylesterase type B|uniref:Carboxylic ester hydrolase n=1 Tax=Tilletiopsis washingtonensis TaxID=58919 RepID=A0A316YZ92_9BASI|nr:alpha/beta-hydrolase [Tilletiopsis washingtonensis]PWN94452.1 alpha/beta-hydrolase [Tilletiopsis washingtonensis]